ncbi:MAG: ACP S-malonyltransferase [Clostridiales bacterium]|nr:ACP S-malonyltransferase [Clostridiales bacterium]
MNDICILFPGEGVEYIGMRKSLYDNYPEARKIFDIANRTLGYKLSDIIFYGSNESLSDQRVLQPAILMKNVYIERYIYEVVRRIPKSKRKKCEDELRNKVLDMCEYDEKMLWMC